MSESRSLRGARVSEPQIPTKTDPGEESAGLLALEKSLTNENVRNNNTPKQDHSPAKRRPLAAAASRRRGAATDS